MTGAPPRHLPDPRRRGRTDAVDLAHLLDLFPMAAVVTGNDGRIRQINDEAVRQLGYPLAAVRGQPLSLLLPELELPAAAGVLVGAGAGAATLAQQSPRQTAQRRDGSRFAVEMRVRPLGDEGPGDVVVTLTDVTEQRQAHDERDAMIDAAPLGMVVVGADGRIERANQRLAEMFGYAPQALIGEPLDRLLPPRHRAGHADFLATYLERPGPRLMGVGRDLTALHRDGSEFPVEIGLNLVHDADGPHVIAAINDITARKQTELALRQANADLDEFSYVTSHDLKAPVRGIGNLLEWIEEDLGDGAPEGVRENLGRARARVERMQSMIDDLLAYARSGRVASTFRNVELCRLIAEVVDTIAPPPGFRIGTELGVVRLYTSRTPLATVLRNLVGNAVEHHDRDEGDVRIRTRSDGAYCVFEVCDDGPGVPAASHDRICKLFQTLSPAGGRPHSGIGLAVAKRLIQVHGGRLEIDSQAGRRGSVFRFWWPLVDRRELHGSDDD